YRNAWCDDPGSSNPGCHSQSGNLDLASGSMHFDLSNTGGWAAGLFVDMWDTISITVPGAAPNTHTTFGVDWTLEGAAVLNNYTGFRGFQIFPLFEVGYNMPTPSGNFYSQNIYDIVGPGGVHSLTGIYSGNFVDAGRADPSRGLNAWPGSIDIHFDITVTGDH